MRGFSYPPVLESEVLVLFGMLIPYLDDEFVIKEFNASPGFPDCIALRNGVEVGVEFEVKSGHFYEHKHHLDQNVGRCNIIVCWKNTLGSYIRVVDKYGKEHVIEIFELEGIVKEKTLMKQFFPINKPQPPQEWNEELFLEELRKKVVEEKIYRWIKELVQVCKQSPEFTIACGRGRRQATLGFHIKIWLSQGIGVPTPIQFTDDGRIVFDCQNMEKIPQIKTELIKRINQIRAKKWSRWCSMPIRDENTFKAIKEIIMWLTETISQ